MKAGQAKPLMDFARKRQGIYRAKQRGDPWPWVDDEIFNTYSFTNIFRWQDRTSKWLIDNWYGPNAGHPNLPFACVLARTMNRVECLEEVGFPKRWNEKKFLDIVIGRRERGEKVINTAYQLRPWFKLHYPENFKSAAQLMTRIHDLKDSWVDSTSLEATVKGLTAMVAGSGIAMFVSNEAAADLRYTPRLANVTDANTWTHVGPGSQRGLNRLFGRPLGTKLKEHVQLEEMQGLLVHMRKLSRYDTAFEIADLRAVEDSLCEFDKYLRTESGEGKPKHRFFPVGHKRRKHT